MKINSSKKPSPEMGEQTFAGGWSGEISTGVKLSRSLPVIMAGPCMLESLETGLETGKFLKSLCQELGLPYVFKSSFDKANRTSAKGIRGPGVKTGMEWLTHIRETLEVPIVTDIHSPEQATLVAEYVDIIQIPAFLCRQRELLVAAASTGKVVQVKKGQWTAPEEMLEVARFLHACGNPRLTLVERGSCFGYNNLVVDFRNFAEMSGEGHAVVFDATHAVQLPGAAGGKSSGLRQMVPLLVRGALATGLLAGVFMEVHPDPSRALSDADTQLDFTTAEMILRQLAHLLPYLKAVY